jgi:hypothetical protein
MCFWFKNHDKNINIINEFKSVFPTPNAGKGMVKGSYKKENIIKT